MPALVQTIELISKTMDQLIDFVVADEFLSMEFENFLTKNKIVIEKQSQLNDVLIDYILEGRTSKAISVLDYFILKNPRCDIKTVEALKQSFVSVFKIDKISKNSFDVTCLAKNRQYVLLPLVKTTSLRGIGRFDFIKARIINLNSNYYILEILNVINSYMGHEANIQTVGAIIKNPEIALLPENFNESVSSFASSFKKCFKTDEIVVSNKDIDKILDDFYSFHLEKIDKVNFNSYSGNYEFFEIDQFNNDFLINTKNGFASSIKEYDIGIFSDDKYGLFVIPFLGTLNAIIQNKQVLNPKECLEFFLISNKAPASLLIKKGDLFLNALNKHLGTNFLNIEEIVKLYKQKSCYSALNILFNSQIFSKVLGYNKV